MKTTGIALVFFMLQGCMDTTVLEYETLTQKLDDKNELQVSTYPNGFPRETSSIPFVYKALRTPDTVNFQVFVRQIGKNGPNPYIEEIVIHSVSYAFPGQSPVVLLEDYPDNFWMQGNPRYDASGVPAVRHSEGWYLLLHVDMTVNGVRYDISEQVHARERRSTLPLILYALQ